MECLRADREGVVRAAQVLSEGGVVLYPTDTLYGLAVDPSNTDALATLYELKGREEGKPVSIVVPSIEYIEDLAVFPEVAHLLATRFLPGALTLVLPALPHVSRELAPQGTVGIRIPNDSFCRELSAVFQKPYTATSANPSGTQTLGTVHEILASFGEKRSLIDLVIDAGTREGGVGSTVISFATDTPTILREGLLTREELGL